MNIKMLTRILTNIPNYPVDQLLYQVTVSMPAEEELEPGDTYFGQMSPQMNSCMRQQQNFQIRTLLNTSKPPATLSQPP